MNKARILYMTEEIAIPDRTGLANNPFQTANLVHICTINLLYHHTFNI